MKSFSEAGKRNRTPILGVLKRAFAECKTVLEIGSGTGQHAVYFAAELTHLVWQTSDVPQNHVDIKAWIDDAGLPKETLIKSSRSKPGSRNMLILLDPGVRRGDEYGLVQSLPNLRQPLALDVNDEDWPVAQADADLRARDPLSGIRDFEAVDCLARKQDLHFVNDPAMPANNRSLAWRRQRA